MFGTIPLGIIILRNRFLKFLGTTVKVKVSTISSVVVTARVFEMWN